jgi:hypothetical protein
MEKRQTYEVNPNSSRESLRWEKLCVKNIVTQWNVEISLVWCKSWQAFQPAETKWDEIFPYRSDSSTKFSCTVIMIQFHFHIALKPAPLTLETLYRSECGICDNQVSKSSQGSYILLLNLPLIQSFLFSHHFDICQPFLQTKNNVDFPENWNLLQLSFTHFAAWFVIMLLQSTPLLLCPNTPS